MSPWANTHIHLPPNFSAFTSVEEAVNQAKAEGCSILGTSNYYDFTVYHEFKTLANGAGIAPLFGVEIICMDDDAAGKGIRFNDPVNPGKIYLCGKALRTWENPTKRARKLMAEIRDRDESRGVRMVAQMTKWLSDRAVPMPSYSEIRTSVACRYGVDESTVVLQERHLAEAAQLQISSEPDPSATAERLFGKAVTAPTDLQTLIRFQLLKIGRPAYVPEGYVTVDQGLELIDELDGVATYAALADSVEPLCEAESTLEKLLATIRRVRAVIGGVELIPNRNSSRVVAEWVTELREGPGGVVTAGTEHNTVDRIPIRPKCRDGAIPETIAETFWESARFLISRQEEATWLQTWNPS